MAENTDLKQKIIEILKKANLGSVATVTPKGTPWVRYMVIKADTDRTPLTLYTTTFIKSRKVEHIQHNKAVHVTLGGDPHNWNSPYLNIQGSAEICTDRATKEKCWDDYLQQFFSDASDPNYAVIKIIPEIIEYMGPGAHAPEIYAITK